MSDDPSTISANVPETSSPLFLAARQIANAASAADIVDAVRQRLAPGADRVALHQLDSDGLNKPVCRPLAVWDRDGLEPEAQIPAKALDLIETQPLVVIDTIYLDEFLAPVKAYMVDTLKAASFAVFPLLRRDKPIGYLEIVTRRTGLNEDAQVRALLMACWQIGFALENILLAAQLDNARQRHNASATVMRAIAASRNRAALAEAITASVKSVLPISHLSMALQQDDSPDAAFTTWHGPELTQLATFNGSLIQQAIKSRQPIMLDGLGASAVEAEAEEDRQDPEKLVIAPMVLGDQAIGTLNFGFGGGTPFTPDDRRLAEEIAAHLATTLSSLRLIEDMQRTLEETTTLYSTSLALTAAQSLEEVHSTLLAEIAAVSAADRVILYLAGPDPRDSIDYVEVAAVWKSGKMQAAKGQLRYPIDQAPVLSQFPQSRSNLVFNDTQSDMRLDKGLRDFYAEEKVNALIMIPLSTGAIWLGAALAEAQQGQSFTSEQIRLCRSLADQAALALDSQILLARRDQVIARERALREITERIRGASRVDEILAITAEELGKVTGINTEKLKTLDLSDSVKFRLSRDEREFIASVQNQVQLAIENLRLLETTRESAAHEQALRDIASALNSTLELDEVLTLILSSASRVLPHDAANVLLVQGGVARPFSLRGYAERGIDEDALRAMRFPIRDIPNLKRMVETRQPFTIASTREFAGWVSAPQTEWVQSYIGAPIYVEDEIIGFLNLDSATPNQYDEHDAERLQAFANQAAIAIRNAQAYQATRMQAEVMSSVATSLQGAAGVDDVLETAVRALSSTLGRYDVRLRLTAPQAARAGQPALADSPNREDNRDDSDAVNPE